MGLYGGEVHVIPKESAIRSFNNDEQNDYLKIFMGRFWEKSSGEMG